MAAVFIYVTVPPAVDAELLARAVVSEKLAACANIIPGVRSIYNWRGNTEQRDEAVVIFKTQEKLYPAIEKRIKTLHSDETPCIVMLPVMDGFEPFLQWVKEETTV